MLVGGEMQQNACEFGIEKAKGKMLRHEMEEPWEGENEMKYRLR